MTITHRLLVSAAAIFGVLALVAAYMTLSATSVRASVQVSNDYLATTTNAAQVPVIRVLKAGSGSFGSVIITGKNTGLMTFYDATTTDVNLRTGQPATSTITIADFPTNAPEGTYTFDALTKYGLTVVVSGATATSTITYR